MGRRMNQWVNSRLERGKKREEETKKLYGKGVFAMARLPGYGETGGETACILGEEKKNKASEKKTYPASKGEEPRF